MGNIMAAIGRRAGPAVVNFLDQQEQQAVQREHWMKNYELQSRGVAMQEAEAKRQEQQWQYQKREIDKKLDLDKTEFPIEMLLKNMDVPEYAEAVVNTLRPMGYIKEHDGRIWMEYGTQRLVGNLLSENGPLTQNLYEKLLAGYNRKGDEIAAQMKELDPTKPKDAKQIEQLKQVYLQNENQIVDINKRMLGHREFIKMQMEAGMKERAAREKAVADIEKIRIQQKLIGAREKDVAEYESTLPSKAAPAYDWIQEVDAEGKPIQGTAQQIIKGTPLPKPSRGIGWSPIRAAAANVTINQGKTLPADEVVKMAEGNAYGETMQQIRTVGNEFGYDTGPLEFIKEKMDNWGIWPSSKRIKLRSLVARLPGLMYAMRGKQLSDKELQVALKMMPKMNTTEQVFRNDLAMFEDYMNKVFGGKWEFFKSAGYNMEGMEHLKPYQSILTDQPVPGSGNHPLDKFRR